MTATHPQIGVLEGVKSAIRTGGFERVPNEVVHAAQSLSAASLHEAGGKIGAMPSAIKPVHPKFRVCGPAVTVHGPGGDNLWLHYALYVAQPGDVLVVNCSGQHEFGYWGEVMSTAAKARQLGGLVLDGCVRDFSLLSEIGFPVFARGLCIRGTAKDRHAGGWINAVTQFGDVTAAPGDLVVGDADGVVIVPRTLAAEIVDAAHQRDVDEREICARLEAGDTTLGIYNLAQ